MSGVQNLNDEELVILNNILVKNIMQLKAKLDVEDHKESLALGETSLKGLISMYKAHQDEITKRGLSSK